jgi:hypothetical protein
VPCWAGTTAARARIRELAERPLADGLHRTRPPRETAWSRNSDGARGRAHENICNDRCDRDRSGTYGRCLGAGKGADLGRFPRVRGAGNIVGDITGNARDAGHVRGPRNVNHARRLEHAGLDDGRRATSRSREPNDSALDEPGSSRKFGLNQPPRPAWSDGRSIGREQRRRQRGGQLGGWVGRRRCKRRRWNQRRCGRALTQAHRSQSGAGAHGGALQC